MRRKTEARCETFLDANLRALVRFLVRRMSGEECYRGAWRFARLVSAYDINTRSLKTLQEGTGATVLLASARFPRPLRGPALGVLGSLLPLARFTPGRRPASPLRPTGAARP